MEIKIGQVVNTPLGNGTIEEIGEMWLEDRLRQVKVKLCDNDLKILSDTLIEIHNKYDGLYFCKCELKEIV